MFVNISQFHDSSELANIYACSAEKTIALVDKNDFLQFWVQDVINVLAHQKYTLKHSTIVIGPFRQLFNRYTFV